MEERRARSLIRDNTESWTLGILLGLLIETFVRETVFACSTMSYLLFICVSLNKKTISITSYWSRIVVFKLSNW